MYSPGSLPLLPMPHSTEQCKPSLPLPNSVHERTLSFHPLWGAGARTLEYTVSILDDRLPIQLQSDLGWLTCAIAVTPVRYQEDVHTHESIIVLHVEDPCADI